MPTSTHRRELGRGERVVPGVWRLRLPLPWPGVPHCNAWAVAAGDGIVLFDTGMHEPGSLAHLERALGQVNLSLDNVRLVACTHAHSDHYGQAADIVDRAGCELWMHPNHQHMTRAAEDPDAALARRIEIARSAGVPEAGLRQYEKARKGQGLGVDRIVLPDRDLLPGVEIDTDLGRWQVYETPGHAPSHVTLHQPDRGVLISGDHLLGRVSLYYDYGWTPDPAGEFLDSLDVVDRLDAKLCLSGHGRPFRDVKEHIEANKREVNGRIEKVRTALEQGAKTPFEIVPALIGEENRGNPMMVQWGLGEVLVYLRYLGRREQAAKVEDGLSEDVVRWAPAA